MVFTARIDVNMTGIWNTGVQTLFRTAMHTACGKLAKEVQLAARADYKSKRKTTVPPISGSMVFASILYSKPIRVNNNTVKATVFAGGPSAPHAFYVHEDTRFRDGRPSPGYFFLITGLKHGKEVAQSIINNEINKVVTSKTGSGALFSNIN